MAAAIEAVHQFAWRTFLATTAEAKEEGLYGAGQDLLADAPSGNIRGAGPGVAEMTFDLLPSHRPAETFMVWTGDKCAPGMFNLPLYLNFADPMHNTGLLLSPDLYEGFVVTVIDMNCTAGDRVTEIRLPEEHLLLAAALRNPDRFAIESIPRAPIPTSRSSPSRLPVCTTSRAFTRARTIRARSFARSASSQRRRRCSSPG